MTHYTLELCPTGQHDYEPRYRIVSINRNPHFGTDIEKRGYIGEVCRKCGYVIDRRISDQDKKDVCRMMTIHELTATDDHDLKNAIADMVEIIRHGDWPRHHGRCSPEDEPTYHVQAVRLTLDVTGCEVIPCHRMLFTVVSSDERAEIEVACDLVEFRVENGRRIAVVEVEEV